jgi:hypothetical protein
MPDDRAPSSSRYAALDGLRGLFALLVALFHLPIASHVYTSPLLRDAYVFVDFFFVLSGFVIAHAYGARLGTNGAVGSFLVRRVGRLWPLHLAVLAVLVALELGKLAFVGHMTDDMRPPFSGDTGISSLLANIFLVHAWGFSNSGSWNVPSWSISAELFAYLAFAAVCRFLPRRATLVATLIVVGGLLLLVFATNADTASHLLAIRAAVGFFLGTLVYRVFSATGTPHWRPALATTLEALVAIAVLAYLALVDLPDLSVVATPLFAVAIYVFAAGRGVLSRLLGTRPMQLLGLLSYSIYLTHGLVVAAFGGLARTLGHYLGTPVHTDAATLFGAGVPDVRLVDFGNLWLGDLATALFVGVVVALSALTWRCIERPGQALFARLLEVRPAYRLKPRAS